MPFVGVSTAAYTAALAAVTPSLANCNTGGAQQVRRQIATERLLDVDTDLVAGAQRALVAREDHLVERVQRVLRRLRNRQIRLRQALRTRDLPASRRPGACEASFEYTCSTATPRRMRCGPAR
jgi:hypothetical protein